MTVRSQHVKFWARYVAFFLLTFLVGGAAGLVAFLMGAPDLAVLLVALSAMLLWVGAALGAAAGLMYLVRSLFDKEDRR